MEKIVIFGTGESAKKLIKALKKSNTNIIAYADNDFNKHGKKLNDIIIFLLVQHLHQYINCPEYH